MQVFVRTADLAGAGQIRPIASYPDDPVLTRDLHGSGVTLLTLPGSAVVTDESGPVLSPTWQQNMEETINREASRRIDDVFPGYMQNNALADGWKSMMLYGVNIEAWPSDAKNRKAAADAGWAYIVAVRQHSDALQSASPINPSDDAHWPLVIGAIYI